MKSKTGKILMALRVLAWMAMFGYAFNAGSQLICFGVSFKNPAAAIKIPGIDQNLSNLLQYDFKSYAFAMSFIIAIGIMNVCLWLTVITLFSKLNINSPFTFDVSKKLEKIAWWLFSIWAVGFIGEQYVHWLSKQMGEPLNIVHAANEFLFNAGIVYIISQVFKHGLEIQEENQQTI